jgi:glycerol-3-phosphate transporter
LQVISVNLMIRRDRYDVMTTELKKTIYSYWRLRIMYSIMIGYAGFYLLRQNFTMAIPYIQNDLGYSKTNIGWVVSIAAIVYGVGKSIFGVLGDKINSRYLMAFGLMASSLMNLAIGLSSSLSLFIFFWTMNSCFQSMGWPPCAKLLTHWFSPKEIGTKWAIWNSSQQIGGASIVLLSSYLIAHYGWRYIFYIPATLAFLIALFLLNRLRDTPESLGLPSIENHHGLRECEDDKLTVKEIFFDKVLKNRLVWYVAFANFFVYIVRMSVFNWGPTFLREFKGSSLQAAGWQVACFDIAGILGGIFAGMASDRFFKGYRGRVCAIFMGILTGFIFLLWCAPYGKTWIHFVAMIGIGFLLTGPQILVGVAAADFASKKAAGAASGFTGTFAYLGTSITGVGVGYLVDHYGWESAFFFMALSSFCAMVFFILIWNHRSQTLE